jgi:hypothetical protein
MRPMHPRTGARVICDLASSDGTGAVYTVGLYEPERVWTGAAHVAAGGGPVRFDPWTPAAPPAWLVGYADAFLRSESKARAAAPGTPWSSRIARWRTERE